MSFPLSPYPHVPFCFSPLTPSSSRLSAGLARQTSRYSCLYSPSLTSESYTAHAALWLPLSCQLVSGFISCTMMPPLVEAETRKIANPPLVNVKRTKRDRKDWVKRERFFHPTACVKFFSTVFLWTLQYINTSISKKNIKVTHWFNNLITVTTDLFLTVWPFNRLTSVPQSKVCR